MRPLIVIDDFSAGILEDPTLQVKNGFSFGAGLDLTSEKGFLRVSTKMAEEQEASSPNDITDTIIRILKYKNNLYALGSSARIYKPVSGAWTKQHADSITTGNEMIVFNENMYWMTDNGTSTAAMGKFNGSSYTDSANFKTGFTYNVEHPMIVFENKLYIGNGRYVASMNTSETFNLTALTLPLGFEVISLAVYGNRIIIGASNYDYGHALFSWNGATTLPEEMLSLKEIPYAMTTWKNFLIIMAGGRGNVYAFNGATIEKIKTILPRIKPEEGTILPRRGALTASTDGNLVIGWGKTSWDYSGIYQILNEEGIPLIMSHIPSTGLGGTDIRAVYEEEGRFYVGIGSKIELSDLENKIESDACWESQIYEITQGNEPTPIIGIELVAKPMPENTSVAIKYKKDNASSWTTWGTINSSNQKQPLIKGIGSAKTLQIRLEFVCSTKYSPQIQTIKIY